ncbi:FkbM family methyltransferase [Desulfotomaculum sp. 1211_IL3151]|uniref:FkbM family methyltransferase n=1 Tax=Desulfotomaculum sp. 1211_IL3151 TaxID=3084055 RepID=UPI002FD93F5B
MAAEEIRQIISVLTAANDGIDYLADNGITGNEYLVDDILEAVSACLTHLESVAFYAGRVPDATQVLNYIGKLKSENCFAELKPLFDAWFENVVVLLVSDKYHKKPLLNSFHNSVDTEFFYYMEFIKKTSFKDLCKFAFEHLKTIKEQNEVLYHDLTVKYRGWYFENNVLDGPNGTDNSLLINRMKVLKNRVADFEWFYGRLCDYRSKNVLNAIINNWLTFSTEGIAKAGDNIFPVNFDLDIIKYQKDEVFVDAGAYIGDTAASFVNTYGRNYKRIYTYEISKETFAVLEKNLAPLNNVVNNWKGVSDKRGEMYLNGVAGPFEGNKLGNNGLYKVEIVPLDEDIKEEITFLKIDVEGVDKEAILGAKYHIKNEHPKIVVDSYHKLADIVDVPLLINRIDPAYQFYLRYLPSELPFAMSYCIYAV